MQASAQGRALASRLLDWYDRHRRHLPWRAAPGERADPYRVWLSEIMLQQTTVAAVTPYFERFVARYPDLRALAQAQLDDVLRLWQGLGYYARARNLHRAAQTVVRACGGSFPDTAPALRRLPGIGEYTSAAIAAIAFGRREAAVDGNVERVMARLHAVETPLPAAKRELRALAATLVPDERAGDFAQALMDLGATICTPRAPRCPLCPWAEECRARADEPERLPRRLPRPVRPVRYGIAYWLTDRAGAVLLRRRPERGLLGGMMEVPSSEWRPHPIDARAAAAAAPASASWRVLPGHVRHGFTHFELVATVWAARCAKRPRAEGIWCDAHDLAAHALPTAMKKIVRHALEHARGRPRLTRDTKSAAAAPNPKVAPLPARRSG